ncbi:MAG TPA: ChaN family lipoprotein, partial [Vicinamibacterales bacterium]
MMRVVVALAVSGAVAAAQSYVPERVFDSASGRFSDFETMIAAVAHADVAFLGEQHDDAHGHRLELAVLEGLARRRSQIVLGLEMFERDVQEPLDHFSMGHLTEGDFLRVARPWPRYATDYAPVVAFAIAHDWPIVATNAPQAIVTEVSTGGLDVLQGKAVADRKLVAADLQCPTGDDYHARFMTARADHPLGDGQAMDRLYLAQCVRDETMAESVAQAWQVGALSGQPLVVHINGAFHSDFREGTAARAIRRLPGK